MYAYGTAWQLDDREQADPENLVDQANGGFLSFHPWGAAFSDFSDHYIRYNLYNVRDDGSGGVEYYAQALIRV